MTIKEEDWLKPWFHFKNVFWWRESEQIVSKKRKGHRRTVFTLQNVLIAISSITILGMLIFMAVKALSGTIETPMRSRSLSLEHSESDSEPEPIVLEHSSILFRKGNDLFCTRSYWSQPEADSILSHTSSINNMQFTKDKQRVYFMSMQRLISIIDVASRSVIGTLDLPDFNSGWFVLKKPDLEEVIYVADGENGSSPHSPVSTGKW